MGDSHQRQRSSSYEHKQRSLPDRKRPCIHSQISPLVGGARAGNLLGEDATAWAGRAASNSAPLLLRADDIPLDVIRSLGEKAVAAVGEKRIDRRRWNFTAEAARQTMGYRFASFEDRGEAVTGLVVDAAEQSSLRLTPSSWHRARSSFVGAMSRQFFALKNSTVYSSNLLLEAEDRLLELSRDLTGPDGAADDDRKARAQARS